MTLPTMIFLNGHGRAVQKPYCSPDRRTVMVRQAMGGADENAFCTSACLVRPIISRTGAKPWELWAEAR